MFDAFIRFANGIISHEASRQGGGGGGQQGSRGRTPQPPPDVELLEEFHLDADSLTISRAYWRAQVYPEESGDAPLGAP